ncbi:MAG: molecular chaperone DnaJ [Alphaproteobacteria bacterium]|nr:molecular chaperone DnaJ [Alphaproteobacteria bacterium]
MIYILGGIVLLTCVWLMARAFMTASPRQLAIGVKWIGGLGLGVLALFLLLRGNFQAMGATLTAILPLLMRWGWLKRILFPTRTSTAGGPTSTGGSALDTAFLRVALDHATGRMTGEVIAGRHAGRRLEDLAMTEAVDLLAEASSDPASVQVLEAFLDREHPAWREQAAPPPPSPDSGRMTRAEALRVLDLPENATSEQIKDAHRRLMLANHPDRGGSTYLAAQINRAKDVLLEGS